MAFLQSDHNSIQGQQRKPVLDARVKLSSHFGDANIHLTPGWSTAFYASLLVCDITAGDEVIMPAMAPAGIAHAIQLVGAKPVFADISETNLLVTPETINAVLTEKTRAIVVSHLYGQFANIEPIKALLDGKDIRILEDASDAFLSVPEQSEIAKHSDILIGCFPDTREVDGDLPAFIVTQNENHNARLKYWTKLNDLCERMFGDTVEFDIDVPMIDLIKELPKELDRRVVHELEATMALQPLVQRQVAVYRDAVVKSGIKCLSLGERNSPLSSFPIFVPSEQRDNLLANLSEQGFEIFCSYRNLRDLRYFANNESVAHCPVAKAMSSKALSLPTGSRYGRREQLLLVTAVNKTLT